MPKKAKSAKQQSAEAEVEDFRDDLGPFVVAAETTRMAMIFTDAKAADHPIIFANDSFLSLTGYAREEILGQSFNFLMVRGKSPEALEKLAAAFEEDSEQAVETCNRRKNGSTFWADIFITPVRDAAGNTVQHFASFVDLSRHKESEGRLLFLLDELNHRTQNTLATVQSIALQTLRGVAPDEVVAIFEGRILALSKVQSLLGSDNWQAISLRDVIDAILGPFLHPDDPSNRLTIRGDKIRLSPKAALTLGLALHELATNAAIYGAFSQLRGHVEISWQVEIGNHGNRLRLWWVESGGPTVSPPARRGFGSRLIEGGLAQDLGGEVTLDFAPGGLECAIMMPIPAETTDE